MVILQIPAIFSVGGSITLSAIECTWVRNFRQTEINEANSLVKVKQSHNTPWRCTGGRGGIAPTHDLGTRCG
jgi:hypothetical protein